MTTTHIIADTNGYFDCFKFPAGELQVRIKPEYLAQIRESDRIKITAHLRTSEDIMKLMLLMDAVTYINSNVDVYIPYLPYGRGDRRFVQGDCFGAATVIGMLVSTPVQSFSTLDAHNSEVLSGWKVPFENISPVLYIRKACIEYARKHNVNHINVLLPDAGAYRRYAGMVGKFISSNVSEIELSSYTAAKKRDPITGKFLSFEVPELETRPTLIIDDLCDAGGTFIGIGSNVPAEIPMGLYVTHGVFSKGLAPLLARFDHVYTTDSYCDLASTPQLTVMKA